MVDYHIWTFFKYGFFLGISWMLWQVVGVNKLVSICELAWKTPSAWKIWQQQCSVLSRSTWPRPPSSRKTWPCPPPSIRTWLHTTSSRRTWLRPSLGKFHISAPLPRFSAPSQSPDVKFGSVKCLNLHDYHLLTNPLPWICFSLLLKLNQCDHCALLARIRHPPEVFRGANFDTNLG